MSSLLTLPSSFTSALPLVSVVLPSKISTSRVRSSTLTSSSPLMSPLSVDAVVLGMFTSSRKKRLLDDLSDSKVIFTSSAVPVMLMLYSVHFPFTRVTDDDDSLQPVPVMFRVVPSSFPFHAAALKWRVSVLPFRPLMVGVVAEPFELVVPSLMHLLASNPFMNFQPALSVYVSGSPSIDLEAILPLQFYRFLPIRCICQMFLQSSISLQFAAC